jgi:hypothetical protein
MGTAKEESESDMATSNEMSFMATDGWWINFEGGHCSKFLDVYEYISLKDPFNR